MFYKFFCIQLIIIFLLSTTCHANIDHKSIYAKDVLIKKRYRDIIYQDEERRKDWRTIDLMQYCPGIKDQWGGNYGAVIFGLPILLPFFIADTGANIPLIPFKIISDSLTTPVKTQVENLLNLPPNEKAKIQLDRYNINDALFIIEPKTVSNGVELLIISDVKPIFEFELITYEELNAENPIKNKELISQINQLDYPKHSTRESYNTPGSYYHNIQIQTQTKKVNFNNYYTFLSYDFSTINLKKSINDLYFNNPNKYTHKVSYIAYRNLGFNLQTPIYRDIDKYNKWILSNKDIEKYNIHYDFNYDAEPY